MAWAWVGASSSVEVTTTSHTLLEPAGVAVGDLLVALIVYRSTSTTSITLPAGWQLVAEQKNNNTVTGTTSTIPSAMMAFIVRGASAPSYTFTHAAAPSVALGGVVAYRGGAASSALDTQTSFTTATNVTAISGAGLTTTLANDLLVGIAVSGRQATFINFNATSPGTSSGSGTGVTAAPAINAWAERFDVLTATGADVSVALVDAVKSAAGATGSMVATVSLGGGNVVVVGAFKILSVATGTLAVTLDPMTALGLAPTESFVREIESGLSWRTTENGLLRRTEGSVFIPLTSCTLAVTLDAMTAAGTGTVANQVFTGTLNQTLGALTGSLSGKVQVGGTAAGTLAPLTAIGTGTVVNQVFSAALAATLGDLTGSLAGKVTIGGTAAGTLLPATLVATGTVAAPGGLFGTLSATLDALSLAAGGSVFYPTSAGTLNATLGALTGTLSGKVAVAGTAAGTLAPLALVGTGTVVSPPRTATLAATLDALTLYATDVFYARLRQTEDSITRVIEDGSGIRITEGQIRAYGALAATLGDVTGTLTGRVMVRGTAAGTLLPMTLVGTGTVVANSFGSVNVTLGELTLASSGAITAPPNNAHLGVTLDELTLHAAGFAPRPWQPEPPPFDIWVAEALSAPQAWALDDRTNGIWATTFVGTTMRLTEQSAARVTSDGRVRIIEGITPLDWSIEPDLADPWTREFSP